MIGSAGAAFRDVGNVAREMTELLHCRLNRETLASRSGGLTTEGTELTQVEKNYFSCFFRAFRVFRGEST